MRCRASRCRGSASPTTGRRLLMRGRLDTTRQVTHLAIRSDLLACRFDELSENTPLNRPEGGGDQAGRRHPVRGDLPPAGRAQGAVRVRRRPARPPAGDGSTGPLHQPLVSRTVSVGTPAAEGGMAEHRRRANAGVRTAVRQERPVRGVRRLSLVTFKAERACELIETRCVLKDAVSLLRHSMKNSLGESRT